MSSIRIRDWTERESIVMAGESPCYSLIQRLLAAGWKDISLPQLAVIFGRVSALDLREAEEAVNGLESDPYDVALDDELLKWDSRRRQVAYLLRSS